MPTMLQNSKPIPADVLDHLNDVIAKSYWRDSTTYPDHMQHSYCLQDKHPETVYLLKQAILEYGFDAPFYSKTYRYLIIGDYKYWAYETLVNREVLELTKAREEKQEGVGE